MAGQKFAFYVPSEAGEVEVVKKADVHVCPSVTQSTTEEESVEQVYSDEEAADEGLAVIEEAASKELTSGSVSSPKESVEENYVDEQNEDDIEYESCMEEEEVNPEDEGEEKKHSFFNDATKELTQSNSNVSEGTYETLVSTLAESSSFDDGLGVQIPTASSELSETLEPKTPAHSNTTNSSKGMSTKLEAMMHNRLLAIDNIQNLLEKELHQENFLVELTDKVQVLENDIISKNECIEDLNRHVNELKVKNGDYSDKLSSLSSTVSDLVESNQELDKIVKTSRDKIQEMEEDIVDKQSQLGKKAEEYTLLEQQLETFKLENKDLKTTIEDLQAKNTDYASELENLLPSLSEVVQQNSTLEGQVEELINANKKLEEAIASIDEQNTELLNHVESLTSSLNEAKLCHEEEVNKLKKEYDDMMILSRQEKENDTATINQLENQMEGLRNHLGDEQTAKEELMAKNASLEAEVTDLEESLNQSMIEREKEASSNDQLQEELEVMKTALDETTAQMMEQVSELTKSLDETKILCQNEGKAKERLECELAKAKEAALEIEERQADTIGILEKGLTEEFELTTRLKLSLDEMKRSYHEEREKNAYLDLEKEEMKATMAKMVEDHEVLLAKMAEEHEATMEEHEGTILNMTGEHNNAAADWEQQLEAKNEACVQFAEEVDNLRKDLELITATAEERKATITQLTEDLEAETDANTQLAEEIVDLETALAAHKEEKTGLTNNIKSMATMVDQLDQKVSKLNKLLDEARTSLSNEINQNEKLTNELEDAKRLAAEEAEENATTIALLENGLEDEFKTTGKLKKDIENYQKEIEKYEATVVRMGEEHKTLAEENQAIVESLVKEHNAMLEKTNASHEATVAKMTECHKAVLDEHIGRVTDEHNATVSHMTEEHNTTVADLEERLEAESLSVAQLKKEVDGLHKNVEDKQAAVSKIAGLLALTESKLESTKKINKKKTQELVDSANLVQSLKKKVADKDRLEMELAKVRNQLNDEKVITAQMAGLRQRLGESERHLASTSKRKEDLEEKLGEMQGINAALKTEVADGKEKQTELLNRLNKLIGNIDEMENDMPSVTMEKKELIKMVAEKQALAVQLQSEVHEMRRFVIFSNFRDKQRWASTSVS